jgi:Holliday junction resolvase RusA-like endonuclease
MKKYDKRIKTYYGIPVPPWRHTPMGKCMTLVFIIRGRIPSKKNELVAVVDRNDAFEFLKTLPPMVTHQQATAMLFKTFGRVTNSKEYKAWEEGAVGIFREQLAKNQATAERNGIIFPVSKAVVNVYLYWKGKYRRDNSNKSEGLHDALVKAQILLDDSDRVMPNTAQHAADYSEEVTESMAVIYITIPIYDSFKPK